MELSREEIAILVDASTHYVDEFLPMLARAVPNLRAQTDAARGQILALSARLRQELAKPEPAAGTPTEP